MKSATFFFAALMIATAGPASAGVSLNGPELNGARAVHEGILLAGMGDAGCAPWKCGVNGPALDGTRTEVQALNPDELFGDHGSGETCPDPAQCNGPELEGIQVPVEAGLLDGIGDAGCQPWKCGVNGPELDGTRFPIRIEPIGLDIVGTLKAATK